MANEQISVSRETLRAELGALELSLSKALAELELRLIDRLADKNVVAMIDTRVDMIDKRVTSIEEPRSQLENEHRANQRAIDRLRIAVILLYAGAPVVVGARVLLTQFNL